MTSQANGKERKRAELASLRERRAVFVRRGQRALLERLLQSDTATADDVRQTVELPNGLDPKLFGAVPGPLARAGIIEQAGYRATERPKAHSRPVIVWRLRDSEKALGWLAEHPDLLPDPARTEKAQRVLPLGLDEGSVSNGAAQTRHA